MQSKFCVLKKLFMLFCCLPVLAQAQIPSGYYNGTAGKSGEQLRLILSGIIRPHTALTYGGSGTSNTWTAFQSTDKKASGKLWDIYSDKPGGTPSYEYDFSQKCGNGLNHENSCYNHEHCWPQSKFSNALPMRSDLWVVYPTDYYVNGQRGDLPYGKVGTATKNFTNGSKLGNNTYLNAPSGNCFEPIDSFKGDLARSIFYVSTCYMTDSNDFVNSSGSGNWEMAIKSTLKPWAIQMLLEWHHLDPVSRKERDRNEAAYAIQGNRNPFIDFPDFADCIWGVCKGLSVNTVSSLNPYIHVFPNPATDKVSVDWSELKSEEVSSVDVLNFQGQVIYHTGTNASRQASIPVTNWAKGIYMLQVSTPHGKQSQKIVIQ